MKILLVGGSKSGKSGLAQRLCVRLAAGAPMIYWATMEPVDGEDRARIARHLDERAGWGFSTVECGRALERAALPERACVLFDSVTALLANEMFSGAQPDAAAPERAAQELLALSCRAAHLVCVCDDIFRDGAAYDEWTGALPQRPCARLPHAGGGIRHSLRGHGRTAASLEGGIAVKRWFTGFMMSWGMFLAIPCPCRIWDEKARPHMVACLPLTGGVVGLVWAAMAWLLQRLGCPAPLRAVLLAAAPWLVTGFLASRRLYGRLRCPAVAARPCHAAENSEGFALRRFCRHLYGPAGRGPVRAVCGCAVAAPAAARSDPRGEPRLRFRCRAAPAPDGHEPVCRHAVRNGPAARVPARVPAGGLRCAACALRGGRACAACGRRRATALPSGAASGSWTACPVIFPASA